MSSRQLFDLTGKVAIVTGGATGLGRQMAEALLEYGAAVVVCGRNGKRCECAVRKLKEHGGEALGLRCDVRVPIDVEKVVEATRSHFGRVDILVNNSGTSWGASAEDHPLAGWQKVVDVNLTGVFLFSQAAGRVMIDQGSGGRIVNVASVVAFQGTRPETLNAIAYTASKGGVVSFTRDLAVKWARYGIRVNGIAPGWFPTDMAQPEIEDRGDMLLSRIPLGRFGGDDDLKGAIVFLASDASSFVTGHTLVVDGGQLAA
jgi:NAD(P)-dependent dehydrogenase (short-subunit alcohol dehydrogenase family)